QQHPYSVITITGIVRNQCQFMGVAFNHAFKQGARDACCAEATNQSGCAVLDFSNGFHGRGDYFVDHVPLPCCFLVLKKGRLKLASSLSCSGMNATLTACPIIASSSSIICDNITTPSSSPTYASVR